MVERMLQLCSSSSKLLCNMGLCAGIKECCRCSSSELLCGETYSEHMIRHKNGSIMRYILTYMAAGKDVKKKHHLQVFPKWTILKIMQLNCGHVWWCYQKPPKCKCSLGHRQNQTVCYNNFECRLSWVVDGPLELYVIVIWLFEA